MELDQRLEQLLSHLGLTRTALADKIGVKVYKLNDISRGQTKRIPSDVLAGINKEFPTISKQWLLTGEGDMLTSRDTTVTGSGNAVNTVTGNGNKVSANVAGDFADLASKFSEALKTSQEQLSSSQCQIDRLIKVIEKLSGVEK